MIRARTRRGSALILAIISVIIVAALAAAFLGVSASRSRTTFNASVSDMALHIAEAGIDDTINKMNAYQKLLSDGGVVSPSADFAVLAVVVATPGGGTKNVVTGSVNRGSYTVDVIPAYTGPATYLLRSFATFGQEKRSIDVLAAPTLTNLFDFGAFGDIRLTMDSNTFNDSYDSDVATYDAQTVRDPVTRERRARSNGDTGSNGNISLASNSDVYGDVVPGPTGTVTVGGSNNYISGSTAPAAQPKELPPVTLPPAASLPPRTLDTTGRADIGPGEYHFSSFHANSDSNVKITGPATIVVDDFLLDSNTRLVIDSSAGPVDFYFTGNFRMDSNTFMVATRTRPDDYFSPSFNALTDFDRTTFVPDDLNIWMTSDNISNPAVTVDFNSNTHLAGTIYAPSAFWTFDSNTRLFGAIVAKRLHQDSNSSVHYDEALGRAGRPGPYRVRGWREVVR